MKKNKLYLHMGFHKTGSSSIQCTFANIQNLLKKHEIVYPTIWLDEKKETWVSNHSIFLRDWFELKIKKAGRIITQTKFLGENKKLHYEKQLFDIEKDKDIILSGEVLSIFPPGKFSKLLNFLTDNFPNHKIMPFAYVRSPYSFYCSQATQNIKNGFFTDFHQFVHSQSKKIKKFKDFKEVSFFPYNKIKDTAEHFANLVGVDLPKTERRNVGRGNKSIREQNQKNKINPKIVDGKLNPNYDSKINVYEDDTKFYLTKSELASIKNELDAENDFFRKELGQEFCDDSFPTCD